MLHIIHTFILYSTQKLNTLSHGQYSQVHKMRTLSSVFRATSLEILKGLSVGGNSGNTHFVRCIRADLEYNPRGFQVRFISMYRMYGVLLLLNFITLFTDPKIAFRFLSFNRTSVALFFS